MWSIVEERAAAKTLDKLPKHIAEKYAFWLSIVRIAGPQGLRAMGGSFNDEALQGVWAGYRSSRLSRQWRVIYRVEATTVTVYVEKITPHDYR